MRRSFVFACLFGIGVAGFLSAEDASPRRLTLADALALAESRGSDFLLAAADFEVFGALEGAPPAWPSADPGDLVAEALFS